MINILKLFQKRSKLFYLFLILLGAVNSLLYSGILIFINNTINLERLPFFPELDWAVYASLLLAALLVSKFFQTYIVKLTIDIQYDFELSILQKLLRASYEGFQKMGGEKIYTAISDTRILSQVPESFINILNASIIIICGVVYLFWISPLGGIAILSLMVILLIFYLVRNFKIEKDLNYLRDLHNHYHRYIMDLLDGFKEVKMSTIRSENIYNKFLNENRLKSRSIDKDTSVRYLNNELTGNFSWYIIIGLILFIFPRIANLKTTQVTSFMFTILYLMGPVSTLITFIPFYTRVKIAISRIFNLDDELGLEVSNKVKQHNFIEINDHFSSILFNKVTYQYFDDEKEEMFLVGPIDLEIRKGETVFITGGNGSGKSTFINLLTGLCEPQSGSVFLNGHEITEEKYAYYRNQISAIFTNAYLFKENYDGFDINTANPVLNNYIHWMGLAEIIRINNEGQNIGSKLSKGQQKRLALIYSLLENKQIIVLDEWAAEQDPVFRAYFYSEVLPELKRTGRTIIAVTHDDAFFKHADRLIKFDFGKIISDKMNNKKEAVIVQA